MVVDVVKANLPASAATWKKQRVWFTVIELQSRGLIGTWVPSIRPKWPIPAHKESRNAAFGRSRRWGPHPAIGEAT